MNNLFPNQKLNGFVFSNFAAFSIIGIHFGVFRYLGDDGPNSLIYFEFIIMPVLMGLISARCWRSLNLTKVELKAMSFMNAFLAMSVFLAIASNSMPLGYAVICLVAVCPLVLTFITCGTLIGQVIFKK